MIEGDEEQTSRDREQCDANAMRRASVAHAEHEQRQGGEFDVNWSDWYAAYMVAEQAGTQLPT